MSVNNILQYGINGLHVSNECDMLVCTHICLALIGSFTSDKIVLRTPKGDLSADGMFLTVGMSGTTKSIPLLEAQKKIIKPMGISVPSKFTTEGLADYFSRKEKDEETEEEEFVFGNYGIIVWDEASKNFSESSKKPHLDGMIEAMACLHNHYIQSEYYKTQQLIEPQDPYCSMIGNMVPQYLGRIPDYFWNQGLAGRILWRYIEIKKPKENESWLEFGTRKEANENLKTFKKCLGRFKRELEGIDKIVVYVSERANELIQKYRYDKEMEWYEEASDNPAGIHYAYKKRLTELLGKTALKIGIGRYLYENNSIKEFDVITDSDVEVALKIIRQSDADLQKMFTLMDKFSLSKEDRRKITKMKAIKKYFKLGHSERKVQQMVSNYASKTSFQGCLKELEKNGHIRKHQQGYKVLID